MIHNSRIKDLNIKPINIRNKYIIYWIQQSQRADYNHAMEYAIDKANELNKPLISVFVITKNYPEANIRHYHFMLEGLIELNESLKNKGIKLITLIGEPDKELINISDIASLIVTDRGYLKIQKRWRKNVAQNIKCKLTQIESDVIVPVEVTSNKEEYMARTIRPKIKKNLDEYLAPLKQRVLNKKTINLNYKTDNMIKITTVREIEDQLSIKRNVKISKCLKGGNKNAKKYLDDFINNKLILYNEFKNDPSKNIQSNMSPYLHFGQISPLYIAFRINNTKIIGKETFLEELIIRRELSFNFIHYNKNYDKFSCLPDWAKKTLIEHKSDAREYIYTIEQLERALTHDKYWNAAQNEMIITGKMHGYMRMYWGKKILEWTPTPEEAFNIAKYLNNKYSLDGRDPNSYTGVAWGFGKHDRAWKEREIFGKVRYMNYNGLRRKFNMDKYLRKIENL